MNRLVTRSKVHLAKTRHPVTLHPRNRQIVTLKVHPPIDPGTNILFRPNETSQLGPQPLIQEVTPEGNIAVLLENLGEVSLFWGAKTSMGWLQPLVAEVWKQPGPMTPPAVSSSVRLALYQHTS